MEAISLKAQQLCTSGGFPVTNGLVLTLIVSAILIIFSLIFRATLKTVPGKLQSVVEMGMEALLNLMESTLGSMDAAEKYFPLIATIFLFIWLSNLLALLTNIAAGRA